MGNSSQGSGKPSAKCPQPDCRGYKTNPASHTSHSGPKVTYTGTVRYGGGRN